MNKMEKFRHYYNKLEFIEKLMQIHKDNPIEMMKLNFQVSVIQGQILLEQSQLPLPNKFISQNQTVNT